MTSKAITMLYGEKPIKDFQVCFWNRHTRADFFLKRSVMPIKYLFCLQVNCLDCLLFTDFSLLVGDQSIWGTESCQ